MAQHDLPQQALLQQSAARPLSGEELEVFGKHAAAQYMNGCASTLNDAVVMTIKRAGLAPEQVRRVCEFANTDAFIQSFRKEGAATKYVSFDGGVASFPEVLKDLNDGGGGTVFDRGMADYSTSPVKLAAVRSSTMLEKTASAKGQADDVLERAFQVDEQAAAIPFHRPLQDVEDLRDKLATARNAATADLSALETALLTVVDEMYGHVKQAALSGTPLGHVVQAWSQALAPPPELVKAAWAEIGPRLVDDGVCGWEQLGQSLEKTAGSMALVRETHPAVTSFATYCDGIQKLAHLRATQQEFIDGIGQLNTFTRHVHQHYPEAAR
jgi:hypothetical protein